MGVIRIVVENEVRLGLNLSFHTANNLISDQYFARVGVEKQRVSDRAELIGVELKKSTSPSFKEVTRAVAEDQAASGVAMNWVVGSARANLLSFFHDRLKVYLRDQGARHDLIDAVITPDADDLLTVVRRVEALGKLLDTEDGKNLLAGTKRAANILAAEEKKGTAVAAAVDPALFREDAEKKLFSAIDQAEARAGEAIGKEDFSAAMVALSALREPVDTFFDKVLVNEEDVAVRANRLALLSRIRAATDRVADFSKIAG